MDILITLNNKKNIYKTIKKDKTYTYKEENFITTVDTKNNTIIRKNKQYKLHLKFKENKVTKNICTYQNNKFTLEIKTNKITNTNYYQIEYEIIGGEKIKFKLEEQND